MLDGSEIVVLGSADGTLPGSTTEGPEFMRRYDASGMVGETLQFDAPGMPTDLRSDADGYLWSAGMRYLDEFGFGNANLPDMVLSRTDPTTGLYSWRHN